MLAFLDAYPAAEGHTLVVPQAHHERLTELDAETTEAVFDAARRVAAAVEDALAPDGYDLFQANGAAAGQEVFHSHVHVVPRNEGDDVSIDFEPGDLEEDEAERVQAALRDELGG